jgi:hypothetical protein
MTWMTFDRAIAAFGAGGAPLDIAGFERAKPDSFVIAR